VAEEPRQEEELVLEVIPVVEHVLVLQLKREHAGGQLADKT